MQNGMLISIIVPVYNVKEYLSECVESVLRQTYTNLEIILVDDGSTDGCSEICDEYSLKDQRIKVIHKENAGLGYARNSGLEISKGDYVAFIDSDDFVSSNYIEILYEATKKNNVDECKMGFQRVNNLHETLFEIKYNYELFQKENVKNNFAPRLMGSAPGKKNSIEMCVCGALFNNDIIRKYKIIFPSEREYLSEDIVFQLNFLQFAEGVCLIEDNCYFYRINEKSLTNSYKKNRYGKSCFLYKYIKDYLEKNNYQEEALLHAQMQFFRNVRGSIGQEVLYKGHSKKEAIKNIGKICRDDLVVDIISKFPVKKLKRKQRLFIYAVKYNQKRLLYYLKYFGIF